MRVRHRDEAVTTPSTRYMTASQLVYTHIREMILTGELKPGERIDQDAIAQELEVSRMPVREALRRLEAESLVVITPHRGAAVALLQTEDLLDIYVLRIELEGLAGRLGAERISDDEIQQMEDMLPTMDRIASHGDAPAWLEIDWTFHSLLYEATGHQRLVRNIQSLREEAGRFRVAEIVNAGGRKPLLERHESHYAVVEACRQRNSERVERLITRTLQASRDQLLQLLEESS